METKRNAKHSREAVASREKCLYFAIVVRHFNGKRKCIRYPTDPFTIFEPQDLEFSEFRVVLKRRATDFEGTSNCERVGQLETIPGTFPTKRIV